MVTSSQPVSRHEPLPHARLQPHDVADLLLQPRIEADDEVDGAHLLGAGLGEPCLEQRSRRLELAERRDLLGQRGIVGEGPGLGLGVQEKVEGVDHRHVGDEIDRDLEPIGLVREHQPRQMIALRVLLPVDEVPDRRDLQ